jgi:hypothetical protein
MHDLLLAVILEINRHAPGRGLRDCSVKGDDHDAADILTDCDNRHQVSICTQR